MKNDPFKIHRNDINEVLRTARPLYIETPKWDGLHQLEPDELVAKVYILAVLSYMTSIGYKFVMEEKK